MSIKYISKIPLKTKNSISFFKGLQWYILFFLIFSPKIVIASIPGLSSVFRLDIFFSFLYLGAFILDKMRRKSFFRRNKSPLIVFVMLVVMYIANSSNVLIALGQCMIYVSLFAAFYHGASLDKNVKLKKYRILLLLLLLNILIHNLFFLFDMQSYAGTYLGDSGVDESYDIFGRYGISSMPYQFSIYVAAFVFLLLYGGGIDGKLKVAGIILAFFALLTGDSRISLAAIIVSIFELKTVFILLVMVPLSYILQTKALTVFSNVGDIGGDASLGMRLLNLDSYFSWLSSSKFAFGSGAQSFLEFSVQYGLPGPLDMGYIRILAEFGAIGILFIYLFLVNIIDRHFIVSERVGFRKILVFCAIYFIFNEGLLATRSGHLILFVLGFVCFESIKYSAKPAIETI